MISSLELARICGVSQGTVDRALHDRAGVNPDTKRHILAAAARHGYSPNPAARELMTGETHMAGAIIPSVSGVFFMDLMNEVKAALGRAGLRLLFTTAADPGEFTDALEEFAARRMRAAIVVPPEDRIRIPAKVTRDMKIVSFLSPCVAKENYLFLSPDEVRTGKDAVRYLAAGGHRRILHLTYRRSASAIAARAQGYGDAMAELGESPRILRPVDETGLVRELAAYRPTALFCHNDWLAMVAIRILQSRGVRVPEDVSVLGVDNSPTFRSIYPDLTTLEYPFSGMAERTAAWIASGVQPLPFPPFARVAGTTVRQGAHRGRS